MAIGIFLFQVIDITLSLEIKQLKYVREII